MDLPNLPPELAVDVEPFPIEDLDSVLADAGGIFRVDPEQLLRDDTLDPDSIPVLSAPAARWRVTDDLTAEWAARHWREAVDETDEIVRTADFWINQIKGWAEGRTSTLNNRRRFMAAQLEMYALDQRDVSNGKRKTVTLPSATVRTTSSDERVEVVADKAQEFLAWADEHMPTLVRTTEAPKMAEINQHLRIDRVPDYVAWHARLSCGHEVEGRWVDTGDPLDDGTVWEALPCEQCPIDPLDGPPVREVETIEANPILRAVVKATIPNPMYDPDVDADDGVDRLSTEIEVEVPGVAVRPKTVTAKVGR